MAATRHWRSLSRTQMPSLSPWLTNSWFATKPRLQRFAFAWIFLLFPILRRDESIFLSPFQERNSFGGWSRKNEKTLKCKEKPGKNSRSSPISLSPTMHLSLAPSPLEFFPECAKKLSAIFLRSVVGCPFFGGVVCGWWELGAGWLGWWFYSSLSNLKTSLRPFCLWCSWRFLVSVFGFRFTLPLAPDPPAAGVAAGFDVDFDCAARGQPLLLVLAVNVKPKRRRGGIQASRTTTTATAKDEEKLQETAQSNLNKWNALFHRALQ